MVKKRKRRKWIGYKGGPRPHTKLTVEKVREIWALLYEGELSQGEIALLFNVTQEAISHIATGSRWNEVTGLPRRSKDSTLPPPSGSLRGRPRGSKKARLKKPRKADMKKLTDGCISCILNSKKHMIVKLSSTFKAPDGFPRFEVIESDFEYKVCKIFPKKLLAWLHENGYTTISVDDVNKVIKDSGIYAALSANGLDKDLLNDLL